MHFFQLIIKIALTVTFIAFFSNTKQIFLVKKLSIMLVRYLEFDRHIYLCRFPIYFWEVSARKSVLESTVQKGVKYSFLINVSYITFNEC